MTGVQPVNASVEQIVSFSADDTENPYNWSRLKKLLIVGAGTITVLNSTIASSLPSGAGPQLQEHFKVQIDEQLVLPNSAFLIGYIFGPIFWAPISENFGRRWVILSTFLGYTLFMMATAVAPNWTGFLFFRFLTGTFGSSPISVTGGLYADIYNNPTHRGRAMAWFMTVSSFGPAFGPVTSGYFASLTWQWPFWFGLIFAVITGAPLVFLPETFGPTLLQARAKRIRTTYSDSNLSASFNHVSFAVTETGIKHFLTKVIGRPLRMVVFEPIVTATCLYLSLIFAVLFLSFQAFPIIFIPVYGFSQGEAGLAFLPICVGSFFGFPVYLWWDHTLRAARKKSVAWSAKEEYNRLPLACIGGPFFTLGLFWLGWTARSDIHWIIPILSGLFIGCGVVLVFMALINYLVDAYGIYSASALGAASMTRSTFGVILPFATSSIFKNLGIAWSCSLLGFLSLLMYCIPFLFIKFGAKLRESSPICKELAKKVAPAQEK